MESESGKESESKNNKELKIKSKGYHNLILWQKARGFVKLIYKITEGFPRSEEYGLKVQLRRAAVSVVLNIVEGYRRNSTKEFLRFLNISGASLTEIEACLEIASDVGYLKILEYRQLEEKRSEIEVILYYFEKSLKLRIKL